MKFDQTNDLTQLNLIKNYKSFLRYKLSSKQANNRNKVVNRLKTLRHKINTKVNCQMVLNLVHITDDNI
jgi:hypothetical protein